MSKRDELIKIGNELQVEINELRKDWVSGKALARKISNIQEYNDTVQGIISLHPDLAVEWKTFEDVFFEVTGEQLLRTASEKVEGCRSVCCAGCGRSLN